MAGPFDDWEETRDEEARKLLDQLNKKDKKKSKDEKKKGKK